MDTDNTNEKLQTRREFFKKAAKSVLPILGAIALSHVPTILKAEPKTPMGVTTLAGMLVVTASVKALV